MAMQIQTLLENNYIKSLVTLVTFYVISQIIVFVSEKIILRFTKKTKTELDDLIIKKSNKPISLMLILIGIRLAVSDLGLAEKYSIMSNRILYSLIVIVIAYIVIVIFDAIIEVWGKKITQKTGSAHDDELLALFHRFSKIVIILLGLLYMLTIWGIQIGPLLASLGIAGIAIAFALQNTIGNIFGGISLIIDKTVKKGDVVKLSSGESGTVQDVGLRSTQIKTWNNEIVSVPNGILANSIIQNASQPDPSIRVEIDFGVEYGSDPDEVKKIILREINGIKNVLKDPPAQVLFVNMGDFALQFKLMFWIRDVAKKWDVHQEVIAMVYNVLRKHKINIPFPTRTIHIKKE